MKRILIFVFALFLIVLLITSSGCSTTVSAEGFALGTFYTISADGVFSSSKVEDILFNIEDKLSVALQNSEIALVNAADAFEPVQVSEDTFALISDAFEYAAYVGAANVFNPAIFPLVKLWGFAPPYLELDTKSPPQSDEIAQALLVSNTSMFTLDNHTITKGSALAALDLGGIAKGYAADKIAEYFESSGVKNALINVGGTLLSFRKSSVIGITPPRDCAFYYVASFTLPEDCACATSGDYERYFMFENKRYHHIIDTSGYPADNGLIAVTVVASSAKEADALSTMAFVLGAEEAPSLLRAFGAKGALITDEHEIIAVDLDLTIKDETYTIRNA